MRENSYELENEILEEMNSIDELSEMHNELLVKYDRALGRGMYDLAKIYEETMKKIENEMGERQDTINILDGLLTEAYKEEGCDEE